MPQPTPLRRRAFKLLQDGRRALASDRRDAAITFFAAGMRCDPTIACEDWNLLALLEAEGRGNFRARMKERLRTWYHEPRSPVHAPLASLADKVRMRSYIQAMGLPLPDLLGRAETVQSVNWADLPERVVIKPEGAASNRGVILRSGDTDHMVQSPITPDIARYARHIHETTFPELPPVLIEEFLTDVDAREDPELVIPRDYKVFAIAGMAVFVRVHDRNAPDGKRDLATIDRDGRRLPAALKFWPDAPERRVPDGFDEMIGMAERLSRTLPWLVRMDFYLTPRGPVFGEFTSFPNAGMGLTPFGRRCLLQMWEIWPD